MGGIRRVELPADVPALERLDTSFVTDVVYDVATDPDGFRLVERRLPEPMRKRFPLDDTGDDRPWDSGFAINVRDDVVGFVATSLTSWNHRLVVWHFYVAPHHRRRGLGRALLDHALADGAARGALVAWLETSNLNHPGIAAYRRVGFSLCGLDTTLYTATPSEDEVALFLARQLDA